MVGSMYDIGRIHRSRNPSGLLRLLILCQFVQSVPLLAGGLRFNETHLSLEGERSPDFVCRLVEVLGI